LIVSDFFYVWLKRLIGDLYPEEFSGELSNKEDEAVANPAMFRDMEGGKEVGERALRVEDGGLLHGDEEGSQGQRGYCCDVRA